MYLLRIGVNLSAVVVLAGFTSLVMVNNVLSRSFAVLVFFGFNYVNKIVQLLLSFIHLRIVDSGIPLSWDTMTCDLPW